MDTYRIAKGSPVTDAQVDKIHFREGRNNEHELTRGQVDRLEAVGVKLEKVAKTQSGS